MATKEMTAEEVALKFRIWRMKHRPNTSISDLEKETKIPAKRMRKLLSSTDNVPEFRDHIIHFLDAFERGDQTALVELKAERKSTLPAPHSAERYPPALSDAIKVRQRALTRNAGRPYCLIARQDISARKCVATQNPRDCYGCAAPTRFCAQCGYDKIAFEMSELCAFCLSQTLQNEKTDEPIDQWVTHVSCPLSGGNQITASTCKRMQSEACGKCDAITRVCLNCKKRRVRYVDFGLCLRCHIEMWAPSTWQVLDEDELEVLQEEREQLFIQAEAEALVAVGQSSGSGEGAPIGVVTATTVSRGVFEQTLLQASEPEQRGVALVYALSRVWRTIRQKHPDVPGAVLLPAPAAAPEKASTGPYAKSIRWRGRDSGSGLFHELLITAECTGQPAEDIMEAMLHEATHAVNATRGIKDCSMSEYHNKRFRDTAQELGLEARKVSNYGYAETCLLPETAVDYAEVIEGLRAALEQCRPARDSIGAKTENDASLEEANKGAVPKRPGRGRKAICHCGFIIRVSSKTLEQTRIRCDTCGEPFLLV